MISIDIPWCDMLVICIICCWPADESVRAQLMVKKKSCVAMTRDFGMFIKPDVNQREMTYQAYSLHCWVVFITGARFWTDRYQQEHGGTISFRVQFLGPKRRPPHDILCSRRHQMTSGEELVVKSRKAVGVAVAMQIWVEVLAAIAWKHILRGTQI